MPRSTVPTVSRATAEFLYGVVLGINLSPGQENFDQILPLVVGARDELKAIIEHPTPDA